MTTIEKCGLVIFLDGITVAIVGAIKDADWLVWMGVAFWIIGSAMFQYSGKK